jgi:16S rRNA (cytosine1402-N4)-methyltransferase
MVVLDASCGAGGHASELLARIRPGGFLVGTDRDAEILPHAKRRLEAIGGEFHLECALFTETPDVLARRGLAGALDRALFDAGASSYQLDTPRRGFSFDRDGPLDLRMGRGCTQTAAEFLARASRDELEAVLRERGEEPFAKRIADAVVRERAKRPVLRTRHLVEIIERAVPKRTWRIHPASRCFLALRSKINFETEELEAGLEGVMGELRPGGRIGVVGFQSLEDRIVKRAFQAGVRSGVLRDVTGGAVGPTPDEVRRNRRSRSAKLRVAEKTG